MDGFEAGVFDVGIDLGRGDAGMAKHHLDRPEVGAMVQEVRGKGMPEHVR